MEKLIKKYVKKIDKLHSISSAFQKECETEKILKEFSKEILNGSQPTAKQCKKEI